MDELTRRCLYLSRERRAKLARILTESLEEEEKVDDGSRFAVLYKAATDVCGNWKSPVRVTPEAQCR